MSGFFLKHGVCYKIMAVETAVGVETIQYKSRNIFINILEEADQHLLLTRFLFIVLTMVMVVICRLHRAWYCLVHAHVASTLYRSRYTISLVGRIFHQSCSTLLIAARDAQVHIVEFI